VAAAATPVDELEVALVAGVAEELARRCVAIAPVWVRAGFSPVKPSKSVHAAVKLE
jgi:hypothetical protein